MPWFSSLTGIAFDDELGDIFRAARVRVIELLGEPGNLEANLPEPGEG